MHSRKLFHTAAHITAHAVVAEALNCPPAVKLSVVPSGNALGYSEIKNEDTVPTAAMLENRLIVVLSGVAACRLMDDSTATQEGNLFCAKMLCQRLADKENRTWRSTQPDLPNAILERAQTRANELVAQHKDRILRVAAVLAEKGEINGDELATIQ